MSMNTWQPTGFSAGEFARMQQDAERRVEEMLRLTRNADLAIPVHFDEAHEKLIEEERSTQDKFQIKQYF